MSDTQDEQCEILIISEDSNGITGRCRKMIYKDADLSFTVSSRGEINAQSPLVQFSTQDKGTAKLIFNFNIGNEPINLEGIKAELIMSMEDGSKFIVFPDITQNNNGQFEYILTPDQIRHYGLVQAEVVLKYNNGSTIGGFEFTFVIKRSLMDSENRPVQDFYIEDVEAVRQNVKAKADAVNWDITNFKANIDHRTNAIEGNLTNLETFVSPRITTIENKVNGFEANVAQTTVIQVEEAKRDSKGIIHPTLKESMQADIGRVDTNLTYNNNDLSSREINALYPPFPLIGIKGDGMTDDTHALMAIRDYVISNNRTLLIPANVNCYIPNGIDLFGVKNLRIEGTITGIDETKELIIGMRAGVTLPFKAYINRLNKIKLRVQGVKNGDITVNFAPHLLLWADGNVVDINSIAYTNFYLGRVIHVEINSISSNAWINENKFFGGRLTKLTINGQYTHNHNVFYSPTLENSTINIIRGSSNRILGCRFEGNNNVTFGEHAWDNEIIRSWHNSPGAFLRSEARTSFIDNGRGNYVTNAGDAYYDFYKIFDMSTSVNNYNLNNIVKNNGLLEVITNGLYKNVFETDLFALDTDIGFDIRCDVTMWRAYVELYDVNKTKLVTEPVSSLSSGTMIWSAVNNQFATTINRNYINFALFKSTEAKYAKVRLQPHAVGAFSSLVVSIRHLRGSKVYIPIPVKYKKATIDYVPTIGSWEVGDYADYVSPVAGGYKGAICTTAGTPGIWKDVGLIET